MIAYKFVLTTLLIFLVPQTLGLEAHTILGNVVTKEEQTINAAGATGKVSERKVSFSQCHDSSGIILTY